MNVIRFDRIIIHRKHPIDFKKGYRRGAQFGNAQKCMFCSE
jgi:hypothetical protein